MALRAYYFDASVLVKLVVEETASDTVRGFFEAHTSYVTTSLCVSEAFGALKSKYVHKELPLKEYVDACYGLVAEVFMKPGRFDIEDLGLGELGVFRDVGQVMVKYPKLDLSDALLLRTVQVGRFGGFCGDARPVLLTGDRELADAAEAEQMVCWDVCRQPSPPGGPEPSPWIGPAA